MRAAILPGVDQPLALVERTIPEPGPGEALVRVEACGVCGSDLFLQAGGFGVDKLPRVPGHEAAGRVERLGPDTQGPVPGTQVALYYIDSDPDSSYAAAGKPNLGPTVRRMGVDVDGAFAEYVVRPVRTLVVPPSEIDPAVLAVLTDAVATPYHALHAVARLAPGETLCVLGVGGIGSNAVQLGKLAGARVVAVSRSANKLELARELGADIAVTLDEAAEAIGRDGADVVIQCADSAALDRAAIDLTAPGGRVVFVGASTDTFAIRSVDLIWKELSLLGSRGFTPAEISAAIDLYLAGSLQTEHLTTVRRPLHEANDALDDLRHGRVFRSVLLP